MTIALSATVFTAAEPAPVGLSLTGTSSGEVYEVRGNVGAFSWAVPGGKGTSDGSTVTLVDNRAPVNGSITYTAVVDGVAYDASPVTITASWAGTFVQSLDGRTAAKVNVYDDGDERELGLRNSVFSIVGRSDPAIRYDIPLAASGQMTIDAEATEFDTLLAILETGAPVVRRNQADLLDLPPCEIVLLTQVKHRRPSTQGYLRTLPVGFQVIGDPSPFTALVAFDWDDFDTIYSADTWTSFDTDWSGSTWEDFDAYDWGQLL